MVLHSETPLERCDSVRIAGRHIIFKKGEEERGVANLGALSQISLNEALRSAVPPSLVPRLVDDLTTVGEFAISAGLRLGRFKSWLYNVKAGTPPKERDYWLQEGYLVIGTDRSRTLLPFSRRSDKATFVNEDTKMRLQFMVNLPYNISAFVDSKQHLLPTATRRAICSAIDKIMPQTDYALRGARARAVPLDSLDRLCERITARVVREFEPALYRATVR
ncbi:MAG: hypothetical protein HYT16_00690 [DPANN group archaeon]|nr:hypothetical protein [DPANN group archaeon]